MRASREARGETEHCCGCVKFTKPNRWRWCADHWGCTGPAHWPESSSNTHSIHGNSVRQTFWQGCSVYVFLCAHRDNVVTVPDAVSSTDCRRSLAYRRTDEHVRSSLQITPLSVATDRIGVTAMRAARLQALLAKTVPPPRLLLDQAVRAIGMPLEVRRVAPRISNAVFGQERAVRAFGPARTCPPDIHWTKPLGKVASRAGSLNILNEMAHARQHSCAHSAGHGGSPAPACSAIRGRCG